MELTILTFPFEQLGNLLRHMSLSGAVGNLAAMVIFLTVCALPVIYLGVRIAVQKKNLDMIDLLLIASSPLLFVIMYLMINPGYLYSELYGAEDGGRGTAMIMTFWAMLIGYGILKMLHTATVSGEKQLSKYLKMVLILNIVILGGGIMVDLLQMLILMARENPDGMTIFRIVSKQIAPALNIGILYYTIKLVSALQENRYSQHTADCAAGLSSVCVTAAFVNIIVTIAANVIQFICWNEEVEEIFWGELPLGSIILAIVLLLIAKYFASDKALKEENDLII